jgi:hypothetical protein
MKVFAEFIEEDGISYRKTTLLQFGDSWDLIGSAVLKNPGSATPEKVVGDQQFNNIELFYPTESLVQGNWFEFKADNTMYCIESVFNGTLIGKTKVLNGVIQLFNLFYVKDPNLLKARLHITGNDSEHLYMKPEELIPLFKDKPVYLGWFKEYLQLEILRVNALKIFDFVGERCTIYHSEMDKNLFYHPQYLCRSRKNLSQHTQNMLTGFYNQLNQK